MDFGFSTAVDVECKIGECPLWQPDERRLYWTDIPDGRLYRADPDGAGYEVMYEGSMIGGFTFQADGSKLLFMADGAVRILDGGELETVVPGTDDGVIFNDVVADPSGGVFCGKLALDGGPGSLCRLDTSGELTEVLGAVGTPNGMGFAPDDETFYFTDSADRRIYRFDYDPATGAISGREEFAAFVDERVCDGLSPEHYPVPDGMTVDRQGQVWTCLFGGNSLVQLGSDGTELARVAPPVSTPTSLTFGGEAYRDMYVTSGWLAHADRVPAAAGSLFRGRCDGVQGVPEFRSRVRP